MAQWAWLKVSFLHGWKGGWEKGQAGSEYLSRDAVKKVSFIMSRRGVVKKSISAWLQ
jgi:hypothetical protein